MKRKLLFLFIVVCYSLQSFAQDPQLFDNDWYLEKLIIDGEDIIPPYLIIEPEVGRIYFEVDDVTYEFCGFRTCDVTYDLGENIFMLGGWIGFGDDCDQPENFLFTPIYISIFHDQVTPKNPFSYDIILRSDGVLELTITNGEENQAIYGNVFLSVGDSKSFDFVIYPNPVQDVLRIDNTSYIEITSIKLYDVLGRLVLVEKGNVNRVYLSHLNTGVLFLEIETVQGSITKKIIKE